MNKIIFSKFSNERSRECAIRTDIWQDGDGKRTVRKTACYPEGFAYIRQVADWEKRLREVFADGRISVNRVVASGEDYVELEYLENSGTLEDALRRLWRGGAREDALRLMEEFLSIVREVATAPFERTDRFVEVFGEETFPEGTMSMPVTDMDLVPENILLTDDGRWNLIDYEWTFDFPVPVDYVIYRVWHYFMHRSLNPETEDFDAFYRAEGMTAEQIARFARMERAFQAYTCKNHVPLRELYAHISPGCVPLSAGEAQDRLFAGQFRSTLYYAQDQFQEQNTVRAMLTPDVNGDFEVEFELDGSLAPAKLRWDPLEGSMCRVRVDEVNVGVPVNMKSENGFREGETDVFWTYDPIYILEGDFSAVQKVKIRGNLQTLTIADTLDAMREARFQRDAARQELENAAGELSRIRQTFGFRVLEKLRRARNHLRNHIRWILVECKLMKQENGYQEWFLANLPDGETLRQQRMTEFAYSPKISILVPVYQTPEAFLREMIESVIAQTYPNWELCIANAGLGEEAQALLGSYEEKDGRIRSVQLEQNGGISENTNRAAAMAEGEYIALLDHDDLLAKHALFEVVSSLQRSRADVIYTDEDKISMDGGEHFDPNLKPDFSPDLLRSHNYITHFLVIRKELFDEVGGFRAEFDGAQDYDLVFRCTERAREIRHIPKILYYWRMHRGSTAENPQSKMYAYEAGKRAIEEHLRRQGLSGSVEIMDLWGMNHVTYETKGDPLVSVIIPNKDHVKDLDRCVRSILTKNTYPNIEIVIVENNSEKRQTFAYYEKLQCEFSQVRVERWEKPFNYSAINNFGVRSAKGDYLLFLNNDTELIEPDSIREMLGYSMRSDVGCVGAKLLYGNNTVQHAGIVLGFGGFGGHVFSGRKKKDLGYMMRAQITGNYSAVTAACMMVSRAVFEQMGGFDESFPVALNDMDFCMKVREAGYLIVFHPFSLWHHYESKSRGYEDTPEKKERLRQEVERFRARWGGVVDAGDPYYNPNFAIDREPFTLRPLR